MPWPFGIVEPTPPDEADPFDGKVVERTASIIERLRNRTRTNTMEAENLMDDATAELERLLMLLRYVLNDDGMVPRASSDCRNHIRAALGI